MAKIQIDTLWSLNNIKDYYVFDTDTGEVINTITGKAKRLHVNKRGYYVVYLQRKIPSDSGRDQMNVAYHKIVALAMINNGPYELIEHKDDNPLNCHPNNLKFSTHCNNTLTMYKNGVDNHITSIFELKMNNGNQIIGSIVEISKISGVPIGTLYDRLYKKRDPNSSSNGKHQIDYIRKMNSENGLEKYIQYKINGVVNCDGYTTLKTEVG